MARFKADNLPQPASEDRQRMREVADRCDQEITKRAMTDPDNPPMTDEQLAQPRIDPVLAMAVDDVLSRLDDADDATLATVLHRVADRLNQRAQDSSMAQQA